MSDVKNYSVVGGMEGYKIEAANKIARVNLKYQVWSRQLESNNTDLAIKCTGMVTGQGNLVLDVVKMKLKE